jgi:hypothetical protein
MYYDNKVVHQGENLLIPCFLTHAQPKQPSEQNISSIVATLAPFRVNVSDLISEGIINNANVQEIATMVNNIIKELPSTQTFIVKFLDTWAYTAFKCNNNSAFIDLFNKYDMDKHVCYDMFKLLLNEECPPNNNIISELDAVLEYMNITVPIQPISRELYGAVKIVSRHLSKSAQIDRYSTPPRSTDAIQGPNTPPQLKHKNKYSCYK